MTGLAVRILPYALSFFSSLCIMILELVASRLVATHVGASLTVWTSVIGIMLGGICLGNVLGGRLADRVEPSRAVGPLYALGAFLTLSCLWMNAVVGLVPGLESMPWNLRTIVVVTLDFLVPATVLGMIGPVVAKIAVEQAQKAGSAIGDVYFWGAVGSIVGTFVAGFVLMYVAPISTIVTLVAAALAFLAAALIGNRAGQALGLLAGTLLGLGSIAPLVRMIPVQGVRLGSIPVNPLALAGHAVSVALAIVAITRLRQARQDALPLEADEAVGTTTKGVAGTSLVDLAVLSFVASLSFMAFEMVAGRMVTRHLGSSIYGWTSIIGVLLGGLSLGNLAGGKIADFIRDEKQASWLFLVASVAILSVLLVETPNRWMSDLLFDGNTKSILSHAISLTQISLPGGISIPLAWPARVLLVVTVAFFFPALTMGTVSPVVAKLAVDRLRKSKRTGSAIGQVYAWGMVGSILGTFLAGFVLIDVVGTKGLLLVLAALLAFSATALGTVWHAAWAGIPLGLCVIAFVPAPWFEEQGLKWGIREEKGNPNTTEEGNAWVDESDYYYIKVTNDPDADGQKRTLVLDNLIHGYFILGHPERLDYDYEHLYALVANRVVNARKQKAKGNEALPPFRNLFLGGGAYTFQRYMQHTYPGTEVDVAEIDPAVTRANFMATGLPRDTTIKTTWGDARQFVEKNQDNKQYDLIFGDAFNDFSVPWHLTTQQFNEKLAKMMTPDGVYMINIIDAYESDARAKDKASAKIKNDKVTDPAAKARAERKELEYAHSFGGFLGSWVQTARRTFPHVYIFGTDDTPGYGLRETFVVVASKQPLDDIIKDLGKRKEDPKFFQGDKLVEPEPYGPADLKEVDQRSRGIILTDDYAPVENLLAPVAATRGDD